MDISRISQTRHTTKAFDPNQQIPAKTIEKLRILLRNAPSSVNSQPWHFLIASTPAGRARIAKATQGSFAYNEPKVRNASHVVVLCARKTLDDTHLSAVLGQEQVDGRFATQAKPATARKVSTKAAAISLGSTAASEVCHCRLWFSLFSLLRSCQLMFSWTSMPPSCCAVTVLPTV